jgi:hypothetical protein
MAKSETGLTVNVALTRFEFAPTLVNSDPAGMVLTTCGEVADVTTTETEQLELGAIPVPIATVTVPCPAFAAKTGDKQVLDGAGTAAFTKPAGYISVNSELNVAVANLCVLVKVITSKEVPPALIALGAKLLATCGKLAVTVSRSLAVHVPARQVVAVLVFVTVGGAEIDAVLVI